MSKNLELKLAGLWTSPNDYGGPRGALDVADNVIIDQKDLAESRRGFRIEIDNSDGALDGLPMNQFTATDQEALVSDLLTYRLNRLAEDGRLLINDEDTITGNNRFLPPPGAIRSRMVNWGNYVYVTSDIGIQRYSASLNSSVSAGIPRALDLVLSLTGSSGYLTSNEAATVTATRTSGSPTLTQISNTDIASFFIGQIITGTGIPVGTTVSNVTLSAPVVIYTANTTAGSTTISNVVALTGIAVGQIVSGTGIQENSRVVSTSGAGPYTVVLSLAPISTATGVSVTFSSDNTVTMSANASSGAPTVTSITLSNGSQVAYRLLWGFRNENDAVMLGAPSAFTTITNNTGETRNVIAEASIPAGISTSNFYQLYRSAATPSSSVVPADQMQLVAEGFPSSGDISAGFIQITDQTPDSLKGQSLYTGSDIEGISQANYPPPVAADMAIFRGHAIYANYTLPNQFQVNIDGVGSPSGVQVGDLITITDGTSPFILTAAAAEDIAAGEFEVVTSGSPAQNIADTAASFVRVLNRFADNDIVYAYLISGPNDLPGQLLIESRVGNTSFTMVASANGTAWTPNINTAQSSTAENNPNALLVAKNQQPEAVPQVNVYPVGGLGSRVLRVIPLRDYAVLLTTGGVYRFTGQSTSDFTVEPFDLTIQVAAPETAVALGNECWVLANQGAVSISDGGVRIRSGFQINDVLQSLVRQAPESINTYAFAVSYEADQRYILALPANEGDTTCSQQYCYNYITENWTRWTRNCVAGYVNRQRGLYLANGLNENVVLERKSGTFTDYVDESLFRLITAFDGFEVTLDDVSGINEGDILWQDQSGIEVYAEIIDIDIPSSTVTVNQEITWDIGGAPEDTLILTAIDCAIQWKPMAAGDPTESKQMSEGQAVFRQAQFFQSTIQFATDQSSSFSDVMLLGQRGSGWGQSPWGGFPWGGVYRPQTLRFYVPGDKQYGGIVICRLNIRSGYSLWKLEGLSIVLNDINFEVGGPGTNA